jgi:hypothetical protein
LDAAVASDLAQCDTAPPTEARVVEEDQPEHNQKHSEPVEQQPRKLRRIMSDSEGRARFVRGGPPETPEIERASKSFPKRFWDVSGRRFRARRVHQVVQSMSGRFRDNYRASGRRNVPECIRKRTGNVCVLSEDPETSPVNIPKMC